MPKLTFGLPVIRPVPTIDFANSLVLFQKSSCVLLQLLLLYRVRLHSEQKLNTVPLYVSYMATRVGFSFVRSQKMASLPSIAFSSCGTYLLRSPSTGIPVTYGCLRTKIFGLSLGEQMFPGLSAKNERLDTFTYIQYYESRRPKTNLLDRIERFPTDVFGSSHHRNLPKSILLSSPVFTLGFIKKTGKKSSTF